MSTGWLSRLLYLNHNTQTHTTTRTLHHNNNNHKILVLQIHVTFSIVLDLCYDKTFFSLIFVSKFTRYKNIIQTHQFPLFCPQQQR